MKQQIQVGCPTRANKSPEPTAVGACSSVPHCGTVHFASRRWLSFLRYALLRIIPNKHHVSIKSQIKGRLDESRILRQVLRTRNECHHRCTTLARTRDPTRQRMFHTS